MSGLLQRLHDCLLDQGQAAANAETSKRRETILTWLSPIRQWDRLDEVKYRLRGTGDWILQHPKLLQWTNERHSALLWLRGRSETRLRTQTSLTIFLVGTGKSTLTAMILEELDRSCQQNGSTSPIFFFCDRTTRIEQLSEASQIYRVLLKQLLRQSNQRIPDRLVEQYQQKVWDGNLDTGVCLELFHEAALSSEQLFVILDAFDECPQLVRSAILTDLILPLLYNDKGKVKFFVSSRPGVEFETNGNFSIVKSPERTRLVEVQNQEDIRLFIEENVRELEGQDLLGVTEFDEAVALLKDKADGMYGLSQIIRLLLVLM